jgi:hypothetical protein
MNVTEQRRLGEALVARVRNSDADEQRRDAQENLDRVQVEIVVHVVEPFVRQFCGRAVHDADAHDHQRQDDDQRCDINMVSA